MNQPKAAYEFGRFRIDPLKRLLLADGVPVSLTSKNLDTLMALVEHRGEVVSKDELMKVLWPDTIVEENNLTQQISTLRKALGEGIRDHRYIVTVPGRGYSFVANVSEIDSGETELVLAQHIRSKITVDVTDEDDPLPVNGRQLNYVAQGLLVGSTVRSISKRTVATIAAVIAVVSFGIWGLVYTRSETSERPGKSIAILPFTVLNSDPSNDYLSTGMADALIAKLSAINKISVRPTGAILKYANQNQNVSEIGKELDVDSVVQGTVQTFGDEVRVTVQLVSIRDRKPFWAQSFDKKITDIFVLQNAISEEVARAMLIELNSEEQKQVRKRPTENVQAYQEYVRGRYFWNLRNQDGLQKSIDQFQKAVALDSHYGLAYAGLADAYTIMAYYGVQSIPSEEAIRRGRAAALQALHLDDSLAEAHASLGLIKFRYDQDESGADNEFRRALELNPSYATAHHWYSEFLLSTGRDSQALAEITKAQELDPLSPVINTTVAERLFYMRRYDDAIAQLRRTLEITPDFDGAHFVLGLCLEQKGMIQDSIHEFQKVHGTAALNRGALASLGHAYARSGETEKAQKVLRDLLADREAAPFLIAIVYQGLGDKRKVIDLLTQVRHDTNEMKTLLRLDPRLDPIRNDAAFRNSFSDVLLN